MHPQEGFCCGHLEEVSEEVITQVLRGDKDEYLAILVELSQDLQKPQETVRLRPDLNELCDVLVDDGPPANLDLYRIMQGLLRQRLHLQSRQKKLSAL